VDLDRLDPDAATVPRGVTARLSPDVARVAAVETRTARIAGIVRSGPAQSEETGQALKLPRAEAAGAPWTARSAHATAETAAETAAFFHGAIVAAGRPLGVL
jgi:hypothetical protein